MHEGTAQMGLMSAFSGDMALEKHDAHVQVHQAYRAQQEEREKFVGWYDNDIGASHWFAMSFVKPVDAAMLLCKFNPATDSPEEAERFENDEIRAEDFNKLKRRFEDLHQTKSKSRSLADWLDFAICAGLKHHSWARRYQETLREGLLNKPSAPDTPVSAITASTLGGVETWKEEARVRAFEIIERDRRKSLYPSQELIADEIAKDFRRDGVRGAGGKPLTGAYIKRHALKGISSAEVKQLSIENCRGK